MYSPAVASWLRPASGAPTFTGVLKRHPPGRLGAAPASGSLSLVFWVLLVAGGLWEFPPPPGYRRCPGPCGGPCPGAVALPPVCRDQRVTGSLGSGTSVLHRWCWRGHLNRVSAWGVWCLRARTLPQAAVGGGPCFPGGIGLGGGLPLCALGKGGVCSSPSLPVRAVGGLVLCWWTRLAPSGGARRSRARSSTRWGEDCCSAAAGGMVPPV